MKKLKRYSVMAVFLAFLVTITVLLLVLPKSEMSQNEKRILAKFPEVTLRSVTNGQFGRDFETYLADHFPMRDLFFGIHAYYQLATGRNGASGVYAGEDGYLIAAANEPDIQRLVRNVRQLESFAQKQGLPAALIPVPNAGYILEDKLPKNHLQYPDAEILQTIMENGGCLEIIDLRDAFLENRDGLYYRTDHHLTSYGSYLMYQSFCAYQGAEPKEFRCKEVFDGFYGTGYSKSGLWLTKPDQLEIWTCDEEANYSVTIFEGNLRQSYDSLYFREHFRNMDQYPVFLDGNHPLVTIENRDAQKGKRLLLIKDSYAHCFATFAASDYEMICMVDLRYYRQKVSDLVAVYGLNEILYLYGTGNLAESTDIAWLQ